MLEDTESELVRSALDFDEINISSILVPRVSIAAIELEEDVENIKELFIKTKYSRLPVFEKDIDHIVGVIHQADFFEMYTSSPELSIREIMSEPIYITESRKISDVLRIMQRKKTHMAVIVDQYGGTEGICTLEDIIEELVGEIYDESDEEDTSFIKLGEDSFDVSAELSVSDFLDRAGLEENSISTDRHSMGGWIMELLDRIPEQDEHISCPPFEMNVTMLDEQKIDRILLRISAEKKTEE